MGSIAVATDSRVALFLAIFLQITCAFPQSSNHLLPGEDFKNSKTDEVKPVPENEITKKPDLDDLDTEHEQPDIKSAQDVEYDRGNPIFRDEPIHLHGYTWVLILVAIFMMVVFCCCLCCQKRKSDSPTYMHMKIPNEAIRVDRTGVNVSGVSVMF